MNIEEKRNYIDRVVTYLNNKFPNLVTDKQVTFLNHNFLDSDGKYYDMSYERFKSEMSHFAKSLMDKRIKELESEDIIINNSNKEEIEDKASMKIKALKEEEKNKENPFVITFLSLIIIILLLGIGLFIFKVM